MSVEMVVNELSLRSPADSIPTAQQWMLDLISTINGAIGHGVKKVIHTDQPIYDVLLARDYPVARWRNDKQVDIEARRFLASLTTKLSFFADLPEFWHQQDQAKGLGFAFQYGHLAISLRSELHWYASHLELEVRYPELDENGQLMTEQVEVIHASTIDHVLEHADWIKVRVKTGVRDGADLWERREELFPSLHFCESVESQLCELQPGLFHLVERKLSELEEVCKQWQEKGGAFDHQYVPGRGGPESGATMDMYGEYRIFHCPDGQNRIFTLHIWLRKAWRLHYFPMEDKRQLIVGYVGKHLPTVNDPT